MTDELKKERNDRGQRRRKTDREKRVMEKKVMKQKRKGKTAIKH